MQVTSISLPIVYLPLWRKNRNTIMAFADRYLRIRMRENTVRNAARSYNRQNGPCLIVTVRFTLAQYDTLHAVAAAQRVSVSYLIFGIIRLWLKPSRHRWPWLVESNYQFNEVCWRPYAGFIEENLLFHIRPKPPP